ncbi:MAG: CDP-diacylglycerol--glycerol-3-phosphate 3-phosphatidyltransferase [Firmicutes bacterium HGW-Firmicutes-1]|jgi:CDP-diacylglycerol--glycerol-3-phosphate 3-phosphatidyltransferase|nr:MAG: CDP-diacylglycerol--glycerol-3-phosphate 3-phosphatidyltransferase [Firmicutes bacterium HGW-Firmicutes-1]
MNIANKLTMLRVILIPFFLIVLYVFPENYANYVAVSIFIIASATDWLDGYLARSMNLVTNFGKFMDPLADKLLVSAALVYLVETGDIAAWIVIVIISREFVISGVRLLAATSGKVIAAGWWGKIKTFTTMIMIIVVLFQFQFKYIEYIELVLIYASLILTIISALDYIVQNKEVFKE